MLVFMEGGKPEYPEKNPQSKDDNQLQTQPRDDTSDTEHRVSNPGHIGGKPQATQAHASRKRGIHKLFMVLAGAGT